MNLKFEDRDPRKQKHSEIVECEFLNREIQLKATYGGFWICPECRMNIIDTTTTEGEESS